MRKIRKQSLLVFELKERIDSLQCNGYSDGGVVGSSPAPIYATVSAGSSMALNWTTWPDSHKVSQVILGTIFKYYYLLV